MIDIFKSESKRLFKSKSTTIYVLIVLAISVLLSIYCIQGSEADKVGMDNSVTIVKGQAAIQQKITYEKVTEGSVSEDKLFRSLKIFKDSYNKESGKFERSEELVQNGPMWGIINNLIYIYPEENFHRYNEIEDIPDEVAENFYNLRQEKLHRMFDKDLGSEKAIAKAKKISEQVKEPFEFYAGYEFWSTALEYISLLIALVVVLGIVFAAPIFSETYSSGADDIIRTTQYGRLHIGAVKLLVSLSYSSFLYILGTTIFVLITSIPLGFKSLDTSIQMMTIYSIAPLTYKGCFILVIVSGFISTLSMTAMTVFLSSKFKKTSEVLTIGISMFFIYEILTLFIHPKNSIVNFLLAISPVSGIGMCYKLQGFKVFNMGGITIWEPYLIIVANIILFIVFSILGIRSYVKRQC